MSSLENWAVIGILSSVVWAAGVWLIVRRVVGRQPELKTSARRLVLGTAIAVAVPQLLVGLIQSVGRQADWTFISTGSFRNPWAVAGWAVFLIWDAWILWWLWGGSYSRAYSSFGDGLPRILRRERLIRGSITAVLVLSAFQSFIILWQGGLTL